MKRAWLLAAACATPAAKPAAPAEHALIAAPTEAQLRADVVLQTGWIGVELDHDEPRVMAVVPGGPGDKVHLQIGDTLVALDGVALYTPGDLATRILASHVGDKVKLKIRRGERELLLEVTLEEHKEQDVVRDQTLVDHAAPSLPVAVLGGGALDLAGHVAVVDFWATWCGPCRQTIPKLDALHAKYPELRIVGVSSEDEDDIAKFVAKAKVTYTIARDADGHASEHYLVDAIPTLVVIDKAGVVRQVEIGAGDFDAVEAKVVELMK